MIRGLKKKKKMVMGVLFFRINLSEFQWEKTGSHWLPYIRLQKLQSSLYVLCSIHLPKQNSILVLCFSVNASKPGSPGPGQCRFPRPGAGCQRTLSAFHILPRLVRAQSSPGTTAHQHTLERVGNPTTHSFHGREARITVPEIYRENIY